MLMAEHFSLEEKQLKIYSTVLSLFAGIHWFLPWCNIKWLIGLSYNINPTALDYTLRFICAEPLFSYASLVMYGCQYAVGRKHQQPP